MSPLILSVPTRPWRRTAPIVTSVPVSPLPVSGPAGITIPPQDRPVPVGGSERQVAARVLLSLLALQRRQLRLPRFRLLVVRLGGESREDVGIGLPGHLL